MEKIIINFIESPEKPKITYYYKNCFFEIFKEFQVKTFFFFESKNNEFLSDLNKIYNEFWIYFFEFSSINEVIEKTKDYEIVEATTLTESIIPTLHEFKQKLWRQITRNTDVFRNKKTQRNLLLNHDKKISVNYKKFSSIFELELDEVKKEISYPFIIKPVSWIQSQLVYKIIDDKTFFEAKNSIINADKKHLTELNESENIEILVEEFIDWEMYSIDYYVSENWEIFKTKPVKVFLWPSLGVDDFMNYNRISGPIVENELDENELDIFIKKNVEAVNVRWTFIHHEFKLNSSWILKTIELNWRIWWFRLEMYLESYGFNIFKFFLKEKFTPFSQDNFAVFLIYSKNRWILKWFNRELIERVKTLKSYFNINIFDDLIWKEVWLTKDGFPKSMLIKLKNSWENIFLEDVKFLEKNYFEFLELE